MSAMIFVVSLPMSCLSLFGQQSPAVPYWRICSGEEMKSAMIDVSYAASQTQILKLIHSKAIVSRLDLYLTVMCTMTSYAVLIVISSRMRIVEWLRELRAFGAPKSASAASALQITRLSMVRNFSCQ